MNARYAAIPAPYYRRRRVRGRAVLGWIERALCLAVLYFLGVAFYRYAFESPSFLIKSVRVDGQHILSTEDILSAAGIPADQNLLRLDSAGLSARIESLPYVRRARAQRMFPDSLVIQIDERVAVAALIIDNKLYEIDQDGAVLRELAMNETFDGPIISEAPGITSVEPGQKLESEPLLAALSVWEHFAASPMADEVTVSEIAAPDVNSIRMYCDDLNYEIIWGRGDFDKQSMRLNVLWSERGRQLRCSEYLDLRFGKDIACK